MEADPRSFQSINIGLACVESGTARFTQNNIYSPPPLSHWRNNLTALSQRYNLYVVASNEVVIVYKPSFPFQRLGRLAQLAIPPTTANPEAGGYIDHQRPHSINHLIIGDLGTEEILLVATDSGNVTAYYTKSIEEAIRKDPYRFSTDARSDVVGVRPFFSEWVHESAWGLSIHARARMIAVSANTPHHIPMDDPCAKITVFAFALSGSNDRAEELDEHEVSMDGGRLSQWHEWEAHGDAEPPPRDKNYKITLAGFEGHDANIPSVSFVNTDQDSDGRWLMSTDIDGSTKVWQIWKGYCYRSWNFAEKNIRAGWLRRREGGWAVAALDPRAFRSAWTMEEFCGHSRAPQYHGHIGESYDITNIVRLRTPGNSHAHPLMAETSDDSDDPAEVEETTELWPDSDDITDLDPGEDHTGSNDQGQLTTYQDYRDVSLGRDVEEFFTPSEGNDQTQGGEHDQEVILADPRADDVGVFMALEDSVDGSDQMALVEATNTEPRGEHGHGVHYESSSEEPDEDLSSTSHRSTTSLSSLAQRNSQDLEGDERALLSNLNASQMHPSPKDLLSKLKRLHRPWQDRKLTRSAIPIIPMLHCSASNLRLLNAPNANSPHLFCANVLKQALPPIIERNGLGNFERLNMVQQIPELGVVIVASQIGRCAICSLTRNERTGAFGLRVDWTLPTRKQESRMLRPVRPLLGIAASPIQGRSGSANRNPVAEQEESISWGNDGVLDGVSTTFDPVVLLLRDSRVQSETISHSSEEAEGETSASGARRAKRTRLSYGQHDSSPSQQHSEVRRWTIPTGNESWKPLENSRRYRLMLTYSDMTVFTYEISRGVERDDVAQGEGSVLDLVD